MHCSLLACDDHHCRVAACKKFIEAFASLDGALPAQGTFIKSRFFRRRRHRVETGSCDMLADLRSDKARRLVIFGFPACKSSGSNFVVVYKDASRTPPAHWGAEFRVAARTKVVKRCRIQARVLPNLGKLEGSPDKSLCHPSVLDSENKIFL